MSPPHAQKFGRPDGEDVVPHDYGDVYFEEPSGSATRLVIGPSRDHVELLTELAAEMRGAPWYVLYVLLVPRRGERPPGRYQSRPFATHAELAGFLSAFRAFFEGDGRHHVWVGSPNDGGLLVYDQHNVLFAYGPVEQFEQVLARRSFRQAAFWFPSPHAHRYLPENDAEENRLMAEGEWQHFPLQPGDDWD